jgi:hypothetical protein
MCYAGSGGGGAVMCVCVWGGGGASLPKVSLHDLLRLLQMPFRKWLLHVLDPSTVLFRIPAPASSLSYISPLLCCCCLQRPKATVSATSVHYTIGISIDNIVLVLIVASSILQVNAFLRLCTHSAWLLPCTWFNLFLQAVESPQLLESNPLATSRIVFANLIFSCIFVLELMLKTIAVGLVFEACCPNHILSMALVFMRFIPPVRRREEKRHTCQTAIIA